MKIAVFIREVIDSNINLGFCITDPELVNKGLAYKLNSDDMEALSQSLNKKKNDNSTEIIVISIGPEKIEEHLKNALSLGADKAVRIWKEEIGYLSSYHKAEILIKTISLFNTDIVLIGSRSLDGTDEELAGLIAAKLDLPYIHDVVGFEVSNDKNNIKVTKNIGKGIQEMVLSPIPAVLSIHGEGKGLPYARLDDILEARDKEIYQLTLSDLGISIGELSKEPTKVIELAFPRPRPKKVFTPDSSLPAFYRILQLLQGGITNRRAAVFQGDIDKQVDQFIQLLIEEKVIQKKGKS